MVATTRLAVGSTSSPTRPRPLLGRAEPGRFRSPAVHYGHTVPKSLRPRRIRGLCHAAGALGVVGGGHSAGAIRREVASTPSPSGSAGPSPQPAAEAALRPVVPTRCQGARADAVPKQKALGGAVAGGKASYAVEGGCRVTRNSVRHASKAPTLAGVVQNTASGQGSVTGQGLGDPQSQTSMGGALHSPTDGAATGMRTAMADGPRAARCPSPPRGGPAAGGFGTPRRARSLGYRQCPLAAPGPRTRSRACRLRGVCTQDGAFQSCASVGVAARRSQASDMSRQPRRPSCLSSAARPTGCPEDDGAKT
jgi:hypothetical protein